MSTTIQSGVSGQGYWLLSNLRRHGRERSSEKCCRDMDQRTGKRGQMNGTSEPERVRAMASDHIYMSKRMNTVSPKRAFARERKLRKKTTWFRSTDGKERRREFTQQKALGTRLDSVRLIILKGIDKEKTAKVVVIKEKLQAARDRQKSYTDNRRKPLEFEHIRKVVRGIEWCNKTRFHVSNLKKRVMADASLPCTTNIDEIKVDKTLCFVEEPVEIMDREIKSLKRSKISLMKIDLMSRTRLNYQTRFSKVGDTVTTRDLDQS
ncbi:hypothetical protein Tco_0791444 [Tanacetum coccineum]